VLGVIAARAVKAVITLPLVVFKPLLRAPEVAGVVAQRGQLLVRRAHHSVVVVVAASEF
jgi:hypothetical protein